MTMRSKRVLWLLNHTTLMKTEVPILLAMGYEVFIPKILPSDVGFRSGSIDYSHDKQLTLPPHVLAALNATDFNSRDWPDLIVGYVNKYFGMVFFMPMPFPIENSVKRFTGAVMLRAFGLDSTQTYADVLRHFFRDSLKWIYAIRDRFWFASGYEQLSEVEPKLIADRDVFLPLAMPTEFALHRDTWTGEDKQIIFVCPNIKTDVYYGRVYEDFKRAFGDLPHVIIGTQKVPVEDPRVLGFVSDDELITLLKRSAVMYYHSHEPRHLHYSPVEGAEVGTPLVFYRDNLLARMIGHSVSGSVDNVDEAREKIVAILEGNDVVIETVRKEQQVIIELFSESRCLDTWRTAFAASGLRDFLDTLDDQEVSVNRAGTIKYDDVPRDLLKRSDTEEPVLGSLEDGFMLSSDPYPAFVEYVDGIAPRESWGAWSDGEVVEMTFAKPLPVPFQLVITAGALGENVGAPVLVEVGDNKRWASFSTPPWEPTTVRLPFNIFESSHTVKIHVPFPTRAPGSDHAIGIGLVKISVEPLND
jgi:hypothetical protein